MDLTNTLSIIGNTLQFVSIILAIIQLLASKKDDSESLSVLFNNYNISIINNEITRKPLKNNSYQKENTEFLVQFLVGLFILTFSIAFHSIISILLSFVTAIYLFKTIYFTRKNQLPFKFSCLLIGHAIILTVISLSTFYFTPQLVKIANSFPNIPQFQQGLSALINWFVVCSKIVLNNINLSNSTNAFAYTYITLRCCALAFLIPYIIFSIKSSSMLNSVIKLNSNLYKTVFKNLILILILVLAFHINLIYFSILTPIIKSISTWMKK